MRVADRGRPKLLHLTLVAELRIRVFCMALAEDRIRSIIESILLTSAEPVPAGRLVEVILIEDPKTEEASVKAAIKALMTQYEEADRPVARGFRVEEVAGGLQLRTVAENAQYVRRFLAAKPQRLSKAALETLSIIAYRQPCTKPEVETIRGVDVGAALKNLLDRDFIRILGKKDEVGRPLLYGTTENFLQFFGLKALAELPTLREYTELDEEHQKEVDALSVADLAAVASNLVEVRDDPDLKALEQAVETADRVRRESEEALTTRPPAEPPPDDGDGPTSSPAETAPDDVAKEGA